MMNITLEIPDDEVDTFIIRRMGAGDYVVTVFHRFGYVLDKHGQILGPSAPHGIGIGTDLPTVVGQALDDLRKEVARKRDEQSNRDRARPLPVKTQTFNLDLDLDL